jgi:hypothetical protein
LIRKIQRRGWFVEQQQLFGAVRLGPLGRSQLRQGARNHDPLFFAARQRAERSVFERQRPGHGQGLTRNRKIGGPLDLEGAQMRVATHERDLAHGVIEHEVRLLRNDGHPSCNCAALKLAYIDSIERDAAL